MSPAAGALYERLIERDLDAVPEAVRAFRESEGSDQLFLAVARFAVMAYAPSQHSKHAFLAALAAHDLRADYGERWDDLLVECARYAAESRQPWSEPPMLEPPAVGDDVPHDIDALRDAISTRDRLAAERWLAARLDDDNLLDDLLAVAADNFEDLGHKVIITRAAWRLVPILGQKGKYATLRVAVWELMNDVGPTLSGPAATVSGEALINNAVAEQGSIESVQAVFLYEAAKGTKIFDRVCGHLATLPLKSGGDELPPAGPPPVYRLARDYAQCLSAYAIRDERLKSAAAYNLEHGPSFADWSFA